MTVQISSSSSRAKRKRRQPWFRIPSSRKSIVFLGLIILFLALIQFFLSSVHTLHPKDHRFIGGGSLYQQLHDFHNASHQRSQRGVENDEKNQNDNGNDNESDDDLKVQDILLRTMNRKSLPLKAYTEPPLQPGTPLPMRVKPQLQEYTYPNVNGCQDLANFLPVHHFQDMDDKFGPIVGQLHPSYPNRVEYAQTTCPVDADPFLPWIHDVFLTGDGTFMEFIAPNKRRCRSAPSFADDLKHLEPQVALLQSVPIKRLFNNNNNNNNNSTMTTTMTTTAHRYRLASLEDADEDAKETRFICRFHTLRPIQKKNDDNNQKDENKVDDIVVGETLSVFPYNYEHANFRKGPQPKPLLTRPKDGEDTRGAHNENIWNAMLLFRCPVPEAITTSYLESSSSSSRLLFHNVPKFYVDLVPIRTPPRETREGYFPQLNNKKPLFDPEKEWGKHHVLPPVEESGRWANIPVCRPTTTTTTTTTESQATRRVRKITHDNTNLATTEKKNFLVGCLWASAAFSTRGTEDVDTSTQDRLLEWLTFHLQIAKFDHIYIYDNSEAHSPTGTLKPIIDLFPSDKVTRIPWKHRVCNNNRPMHRNIGERSSQYAAEASCRLRYGPETEWLISFDTDEYLIPQSNWADLKSWLQTGVETGKIANDTHILSFFQTRALPNVDHMDPYVGPEKECRNDNNCLAKRSNVTFLEAYDCEQTSLPKPEYGWRAKKQIYRPDFVLNHFVHYTTATRRLHEAPEERAPPFVQHEPYERRVDELTEAFMLHTKTTKPSATKGWSNNCRDPNDPKKCPIGIPFPILKANREAGRNRSSIMNGLAPNCYPHERVQNEFKVKLEKLLESLRKKKVSARP